jgi:hypothetical protein
MSELMVVKSFRDLDAERVSTLPRSTGLAFYDSLLALASDEGSMTSNRNEKRKKSSA